MTTTLNLIQKIIVIYPKNRRIYWYRNEIDYTVIVTGDSSVYLYLFIQVYK